MMFPPEIEDLAEVARSHRSFDEFQYYVSIVRTRPYSRIHALIEPEGGFVTLEDVCKGRLKWAGKPLEDYVYAKGVWAVGRNPDATGRKFCKPKITIYRGGSEIKPGDWVALEEEYARGHGEPVYRLTVPWTDVVWAGTYEKEWYYVPKHLQGVFRSLEDFWKLAHSNPSEKGERLKELELEKRATVHAYVDGKISYREYVEKITALDNEIRRLKTKN